MPYPKALYVIYYDDDDDTETQQSTEVFLHVDDDDDGVIMCIEWVVHATAQGTPKEQHTSNC